jgi:hypothetical protein
LFHTRPAAKKNILWKVFGIIFRIITTHSSGWSGGSRFKIG